MIHAHTHYTKSIIQGRVGSNVADTTTPKPAPLQHQSRFPPQQLNNKPFLFSLDNPAIRPGNCLTIKNWYNQDNFF